MHAVTVVGPLMVSPSIVLRTGLSNHARISLRQACPEYANRFLQQAQDERLTYRRAQAERMVVEFLFHYLGKYQ